MSQTPEKLRVDKWLWAARFYKTRSLAQAAVESGKVFINDERVKPAKELRCGDALRIRIGVYEWRIRVKGISQNRGAVPEAALLYEEIAESRTAREEAILLRKANVNPSQGIKGRPTKRDRRLIHRFTDVD